VLPTATKSMLEPPSPAGTQPDSQRLAVTSTPSRLSLLRVALIVAAIVFALAGAFGVNQRANAINDVHTASAQLLALQDIQVRVVHADAIASSSYLRSGQEDPAQRTAYLDEIAKAGDGLVAVSSAANEADIEELSQASRLLGAYVGLVEQARANNRQGFPVGATYQRQANGIVSNTDPDTPDIVSSLRTVEASQRDQINHSLASAHRAGLWLVLTGLLLLGLLVAASVWLSRTFRRLVNVPIAAAGVIVLLVLIFGGTTQAHSISDVDDAVDSQLSSADSAAQARSAGFEAKSQEALTLINRGNGAANEANWQRSNDVVTQLLGGELGSDDSLSADAHDAYTGYRDAHVEIRGLDDGGNWDGAVAASLGSEPTPNGINAVVAFDGFDESVGKIVTGEGSDASTLIGDALSPLRSLRNIVFIAGLAVAALAALGCGQRLREYR
jgi:hypothetical protein